MFYYLYEITNKVNGKIYVGVHKTKSLDDGYMGSGKVIQRALAKHGADNFTKVILEHFDSKEAMYAREKEVVTDGFLAREDTYNLMRGGFGGFDYLNKDFDKMKERNSVARKNTDKKLEKKYGAEWRSHIGKIASIAAQSDDAITKRKNTRIARGTKSDSSYMNSEAAKERRKQTFSEIKHQSGNKNSQFGSMWITNGIESKKIKNTDPIPNDWCKGRKINNSSII